MDRNSIVNVVLMAYNAGLLQYDDMTICGMLVKLTIKRSHNVIEFNYHGLTRSIILWNSDEHESTIEMMVADMLAVTA